MIRSATAAAVRHALAEGAIRQPPRRSKGIPQLQDGARPRSTNRPSTGSPGAFFLAGHRTGEAVDLREHHRDAVQAGRRKSAGPGPAGRSSSSQLP